MEIAINKLLHLLEGDRVLLAAVGVPVGAQRMALCKPTDESAQVSSGRGVASMLTGHGLAGRTGAMPTAAVLGDVLASQLRWCTAPARDTHHISQSPHLDALSGPCSEGNSCQPKR